MLMGVDFIMEMELFYASRFQKICSVNQMT